jgi:hypothetical protein
MKPGATTLPVASTRRVAAALDRSPIAVMRPSWMPISPGRPSEPVPSMIVPCSTMMS